jgi:hypothetical protein
MATVQGWQGDLAASPPNVVHVLETAVDTLAVAERAIDQLLDLPELSHRAFGALTLLEERVVEALRCYEHMRALADGRGATDPA